MEDGKVILQEARYFMRGRTRASWADYSRFKSRLEAAGCYDLVPMLIDILNV